MFHGIKAQPNFRSKLFPGKHKLGGVGMPALVGLFPDPILEKGPNLPFQSRRAILHGESRAQMGA